MSTFSLDTNIVSFYLKGNKVIKDKLTEADTTGQKVVISPFVWYEVQRGLLASDKYAQMRAFKILCKRYTWPTGLCNPR